MKDTPLIEKEAFPMRLAIRVASPAATLRHMAMRSTMSARTHPFASAATATPRPAAAPVPRRGWLAWLVDCLDAIGTRRELATMDERMLKDFGITRYDAQIEANRSFWDTTPQQRG